MNKVWCEWTYLKRVVWSDVAGQIMEELHLRASFHCPHWDQTPSPWKDESSLPALCNWNPILASWCDVDTPFFINVGPLGKGEVNGVETLWFSSASSTPTLQLVCLWSSFWGPGQLLHNSSISDSSVMQLYQNYNKNNLSYPSWMWKQMRVPWEAVMPERGGQCSSVFFWQKKNLSYGSWCLGNLHGAARWALCTTGDNGVWGGDWAREYWRAALHGCQQSPQAQWPPFFEMKSLEATKPFIQEANMLPEGSSEFLVRLGPR